MLFGLKGEIKEVDAKRRFVVSYPSTFGVLDDGNDIVERGAFRRTIESWGPNGKNRIKALYQHDPTWLVGRPLSMVEDDFGLKVETQMAETPLAKDVMTLIEDQVITEQSIGYDAIQRDFDDAGIRHLREVRLYEYSFVTWGMNEVTPIVGAKGLVARMATQQRIERLEKALKDNSFQSEDFPHLMQIAVAQLKEQLAAAGGPTPEQLTDPSRFEEYLKEQTEILTSFKALKAGRVLSSTNRNLVEQAIEALTALLDAADPDKSSTPLVQDPPKQELDGLADLLSTIKGSTAAVRSRSALDELREFAASIRNA